MRVQPAIWRDHVWPCGFSEKAKLLLKSCLETVYIHVLFLFYDYWFDAGGELCRWCFLAYVSVLGSEGAFLVWVDKWKVKKWSGQVWCSHVNTKKGNCSHYNFNGKITDQEWFLRVFGNLVLDTYIISWLRSHKWNLVISTTEKSQNCIKFTLKIKNWTIKHCTIKQQHSKSLKGEKKLQTVLKIRKHLYPNGRIPLPVLNLLSAWFPGLGFKWFKLLLGHLYHSILGFFEFSTFLCRSLPSPSNLNHMTQTLRNLFIKAQNRHQGHLNQRQMHVFHFFPEMSSCLTSRSVLEVLSNSVWHVQSPLASANLHCLVVIKEIPKLQVSVVFLFVLHAQLCLVKSNSKV